MMRFLHDVDKFFSSDYARMNVYFVCVSIISLYDKLNTEHLGGCSIIGLFSGTISKSSQMTQCRIIL